MRLESNDDVVDVDPQNEIFACIFPDARVGLKSGEADGCQKFG